LEELKILTQSSRGAARTVLLRGARQLVTLRGEHRPRQGAEMQNLGIIQDGALLIVDGVIREVGPSRRVERLAEARKAAEIDASGKVVLPGFIDCLAQPLHPVVTPDEFEARCRNGSLPAAVEGKRPGPQRLATDGPRRLRQFLQHGTLTAAAGNACGDDDRTSLKTLRAIRELGTPLALTPVLAVGGGNSTGLLTRIWQEQLARLATIDAGECPASSRELALAVRKLGFALRIRGDARLAVEIGACLAYDGEPWTRETVAAVRDAGIVWAARPGADLLAGLRCAPVRERIDEGLAVALATGFGIGGCPVASLPTVMSLACLNLGLRPAEAITAITINAAFALNAADRKGSLAPGKWADLVVLDAADYRELASRMGADIVHSSFVRGEWTAADPPAARAS
jgi:imidazolonepropionase